MNTFLKSENVLSYSLFIIVFTVASIVLPESYDIFSKQNKRRNNEHQVETIHSTISKCFDEQNYLEFVSNIKTFYLETSLDKEQATIFIKNRWMENGKWEKALQYRCGENQNHTHNERR
jgi:hypothetical protein